MVTGNALDFVFLGIFVGLLLVGLRVGLINMLAAVLVVSVSNLAIGLFGDSLADAVADGVNVSVSLIRIVVYILIVLAILGAFAVLARVVRRVLSYAWLSWVDLLGGATVAIVMSLFVFTVVSGMGAWAWSLGDLAVRAIAPAAPEVLVTSVDWVEAQLAGSFIANALALPLWNVFAILLPGDFIGVGKEAVGMSVSDFLSR